MVECGGMVEVAKKVGVTDMRLGEGSWLKVWT